MNKLKEFWIDKIKHDELQSVFDSPIEGCIHVREVSPEYDIAVEAMREALFNIASINTGVWTKLHMRQMAEDALAVLDKVR